MIPAACGAADTDADADAGPAWIEAVGLGAGVRGGMSTRRGGVSAAPFDRFNLRPLGLPGAAGDADPAVVENERRLVSMLGAAPVWLEQVHGADCVRLDAHGRASSACGASPVSGFPRADASYTTEPGVACSVLVADCLPVLFAVEGGLAVAAAHAGWRGLAAGVLDRTVECLRAATGCRPEDIHVWMGACIGPQAFEVGAEVLQAFGANPDPDRGLPAARDRLDGEPRPHGPAFRFTPRPDGSGRWRADLGALARQRLLALGVSGAASCAPVACTFSEASRFFSYRRDGRTGRMAACVYLSQGGGL